MTTADQGTNDDDPLQLDGKASLLSHSVRQQKSRDNADQNKYIVKRQYRLGIHRVFSSLGEIPRVFQKRQFQVLYNKPRGLSIARGGFMGIS